MSKITIRPMRPEDLTAIAVQPAQAAIGPQLTEPTGERLRRLGMGFTVWAGEVPIALGGVIFGLGNPAIAWAVLSEAASRHLRALTRWVRGLLDSLGRTVETGVAPGFAAGARWARMLGFRRMGGPVGERYGTLEDLEVWRRDNGEG